MKGPSRISSSSRCFSFGMLYLWNKSKLGQWPSCWFFRDALLWPSRLSWETVSPCGIFEVSKLQTDNCKTIRVVHWMNQNTSNNWTQISQVVFYTGLPASEIESKEYQTHKQTKSQWWLLRWKGRQPQLAPFHGRQMELFWRVLCLLQSHNLQLLGFAWRVLGTNIVVCPTPMIEWLRAEELAPLLKSEGRTKRVIDHALDAARSGVNSMMSKLVRLSEGLSEVRRGWQRPAYLLFYCTIFQ